jgi:hypothetical protein
MLELVLRDPRGDALAFAEQRKEEPILDPDHFSIYLRISALAFAAARTVELRAIAREPFQVRAGHFRLGPVSEDKPAVVELARLDEPEQPSLPGLRSPVHARVTCQVVVVRGELEVELIAELGMVEPAFAVSPLEVVIAFRGAGGKLIDSARATMLLPPDGGTRFAHRMFGMRVAKAERVEIVVQGARTQLVPLARFELEQR